jgi:glycine cleavage system H protein
MNRINLLSSKGNDSIITKAMDGFSYNNIFETKGWEYLVVIFFLVLLIPFWLLLTKKVSLSGQFKKVLGILTAKTLKIPQGVFLSQNHTWAYLDKTGIAQVGLDDLLMHITGEVRFSNLRNPGETITKGDLLAEMEHRDKRLRIFSPVSGQITDTNGVLSESPEWLNEDPYGKGWMYKVKPTRWMAETKTYYLAEDATSWLGKELERFRDFLSRTAILDSPESARHVLQDGGELRDHTLSDLPVEVWHSFQQGFLNPPE